MKRRYPVPTPTARPSGRRLTTVLVGAALAAVTSGCQMSSPLQTNVPYRQADGVEADVGQLALRDLALVGDGTGPAVIAGGAYNLGGEELTVTIAPQADPNATTPPAGSELKLGPYEQVNLATKGLQLNAVKTKPGALAPMTVTSNVGGTTVVKVPVLPPTLYYSTVTPAPTGG